MPRARGTGLLSIDRSEQFLHSARRRRAEILVESNRLGEFLSNELVALRQFAIRCKRPLDTLDVATTQRPGRVPRQQTLDLMALPLLIDHIDGSLDRMFRLKQLCYWLSASNMSLDKVSACRRSVDCLPSSASA